MKPKERWEKEGPDTVGSDKKLPRVSVDRREVGRHNEHEGVVPDAPEMEPSRGCFLR